jgi:multidrug efflux pump subunit AcrA (membrane-fusion protein)
MAPSKKKRLALSLLVIISILITLMIYKKNHDGEWVALHEGTIIDSIYGLATLESDEIFRYRIGVTTQIKKLHVKEGATVKKGELLLQLSEGVTVRSPIEGVVTQLDTKENETAFPNVNLITVMNLNKVALSITLEQSSAIRVRNHLPVKIQFESLKGKAIAGTVRSVYPKEGQFVIMVDLKEVPPSVLPGMTADTAIIVGEKQNALLAPIRAVQRGLVTLRENGKTKKVHVKTGFQDSEHIELMEGTEAKLNPGAEVWLGKP